METLDYRWNDKIENFNLKINKLRNEINDFKKNSINAYSLKNKNVYFSKLNNNVKRRELININNYEVRNYLNKTNNTTYILKDDKNSKMVNVIFPTSKNTSNKIIKTNDRKFCENKSLTKFNLRNKRKNEKVIKINEKRWLIATKHAKVKKLDTTEKENLENKKSGKNRFLYLEGEEGNLHVYPVYSDSEVGFESISQIEDESLSKIKKENQDDDDIETTKHLAQWSSDLVHKYLLEAIENTKLIFKCSNVKCRHEEIFKRIQS
ncbi:conserved Plasmodium protein, unknown function [Plasmodium gallinaceum]|uniref:Uncharacterized protein n=1 Tax=Plasmodium gallinaceum TaxID=5849 RepID=A0A1J1GNE1_PLAGA|nr:conserved Plasmodium protein, unknown function [Plasmodium gallinaceum]CRG93983.1 conserved Plasmodium protein, unknown function [Plasmodium gallinaceum]